MTRLVAVVVMLATRVAAAQAPPPSAATVLANVQRFYATTNHLTSAFRQYLTTAPLNTTTTSDGTLWLLRPSSYRLDYMEKRQRTTVVSKSFIFDGSALWVVDHAHKQLVQHHATSKALPPTLAFFDANLTTQFDVAYNTSTRFGNAHSVVLELTPKQPSTAVQSLIFIVDPADWHVSESIVIDAGGNTNELAFYAANFKSTPRASLFQVIPSSVRNYQLVKAPSAPVTSPTVPAGSATPVGPTP